MELFSLGGGTFQSQEYMLLPEPLNSCSPVKVCVSGTEPKQVGCERKVSLKIDDGVILACQVHCPFLRLALTNLVSVSCSSK